MPPPCTPGKQGHLSGHLAACLAAGPSSRWLSGRTSRQTANEYKPATVSHLAGDLDNSSLVSADWSRNSAAGHTRAHPWLGWRIIQAASEFQLCSPALDNSTSGAKLGHSTARAREHRERLYLSIPFAQCSLAFTHLSPQRE